MSVLVHVEPFRRNRVTTTHYHGPSADRESPVLSFDIRHHFARGSPLIHTNRCEHLHHLV